jgi:hypothetical protein
MEPGVAGGIIAASAMPRMALMRRQRKLEQQYPWLVHRLLDPQLYLATLPGTAKHAANLATYPWFGAPVPQYDSQQHKVVADWMRLNDRELRAAWEGKTHHPTLAASAAVDLQLKFGVEAIILPGLLTATPSDQFEPELEYIDAGIKYSMLRNIKIPIYASVVITDSVLRGISPLENSLLRTISDQIAARQQLDGVYLVIEQSADRGHCYNCEEGCLAILLLIDDLNRGAGKQVIINYAGFFGALCMAAGASIWASGHYRSQRRLKLADEEEDGGSAFPRYYSPALLGDIGLKENVDLTFQSSLREWLFKPRTKASETLASALAKRRRAAEVLDWAYEQANTQAAAEHYYEICVLADAFLKEMPVKRRLRAAQHWLETAARLAEKISVLDGYKKGTHTDVGHQKVWLSAFNKWRSYAKV